MRERIALTEEMIVELLQLRDEGKGLRSLGRHFGVSHMTIKRWLESDEVARFVASTGFKGFAGGDNAILTRDVKSGAYHLKEGDTVIYSEFDPETHAGWVSGGHLPIGVQADVPMDALEKNWQVKAVKKL